MTKKKEINIIYAPQTSPPRIHYEDDSCIIWHSGTKQSGMPNVAMSWYSLRKPTPDDSLYVVEPRCVHDVDYTPAFAGKFKYIFTWAVKGFPHHMQDRVVEVNHPSCLYTPSIEKLEEIWSKPWSERRDEIAIIANNKSSRHESELYSLRVLLADKLSNEFNVKWYGQIPLKKPYFARRIDVKQEVLRDVKFTICTENSYHPKWSYNYFTEKMPDAWFNGAVPIYMGCHNIDELGFSPDSYIDLRPYVSKSHGKPVVDFPQLMDRLKNFTVDDYEKMRTAFFENIKKPNGLYHVISYDRVYRKMANTLVP